MSKQVCFYYLIISLNLKLELPSGQEFVRWKSNVDLVVCWVLQQQASPLKSCKGLSCHVSDYLRNRFSHLVSFSTALCNWKEQKKAFFFWSQTKFSWTCFCQVTKISHWAKRGVSSHRICPLTVCEICHSQKTCFIAGWNTLGKLEQREFALPLMP